ncbi:hypothetical protein G4B88_016139 [Cannabis sativa]|uniref:2-carboxy-D-arabinitol-1-phosphatase n=1 Tax=Cannabis sativa TaxID=3483 RepID=A0A7J6FH61_CANSA|nr:hypothetical protein G4B88_016139 [Cannabis sativa]
MISLTPSIVFFTNPLLQNPNPSSRFTPSSSTPQHHQHSSSEEVETPLHLHSQLPLPPIKAAKRVVLVRHGQSTWNEEGRIQGSSNYSVLTKKGEGQAEISRQMLIDDSFDVCFASPLERSKRTAEIIWDNREEEVITDMDLREIDLYSFQGLLKHEGKAKFGETFRQWQVDPANFNIDGHYPVRELWDRARNCWDKILEHEGRSVLVVAHNAVNQALVATAIGLGTEYFRVLLQSNCGVSVLDFTPRIEGGSPFVCLDRLNQLTSFSTIHQIHLSVEVLEEGKQARGSYLCVMDSHKTMQRCEIECFKVSFMVEQDKSTNMLGVIQSQKIAELLLDTKVSSIISSPKKACVETANAISRVQEAADSLGADCVPRYVEMKQIENLDVENILQKSNKANISTQLDALRNLTKFSSHALPPMDWTDTSVIPPFQPGWLSGFDDTILSAVWEQSEEAWQYLLKELSSDDEADRVVVVVGDPSINIALMVHCLNLSKEWMGSFHLDSGSISIVDFPDGPAGKGVIRCINYTAHLGRWSIPITRTIENDEALKM